MSAQTEWLVDIASAVDELGYGIAELKADRIELIPMRGSSDTIIVESSFLSGAYLRQVLRPIKVGDVVLVTEP